MAASISGYVFISTNFGNSWKQAAVPLAEWESAASSADGSRLMVAGNSIYNVNLPGSIYTSSDFGTTWVSNNVPLTNWQSAACSSDGLKLVACAYGFRRPVSAPSMAAATGLRTTPRSPTVTQSRAQATRLKWLPSLTEVMASLRRQIWEPTGHGKTLPPRIGSRSQLLPMPSNFLPQASQVAPTAARFTPPQILEPTGR